MISDFIYIFVLWKNSPHEKALSPLSAIRGVAFLGLLVFRKVFLAFAFCTCFNHTNSNVVGIFGNVLFKSCEKFC